MVIAMFNEVQVAVLYPALSCRTKPAGPDGIRRECPHLLSVLEAHGATQVCIPAVRPVVPSLIHQSPRNLWYCLLPSYALLPWSRVNGGLRFLQPGVADHCSARRNLGLEEI